MVRKDVDVALIVLDASPLITLARVDRLDVLERLDLPLKIVDQVAYEIGLPRNGSTGRAAAWLARRGNQVEIVPTFVGCGFRAALAETPSVSGRNLGELAAQEYVTGLVRTTGPSFVPLVLFEDPDIFDLPMSSLKRLHLINTTLLLIGMHELGGLPEGLDIVAEVNRLRATPLKPYERPGRTRRILSHRRRRIVPDERGS